MVSQGSRAILALAVTIDPHSPARWRVSVRRRTCMSSPRRGVARPRRRWSVRPSLAARSGDAARGVDAGARRACGTAKPRADSRAIGQGPEPLVELEAAHQADAAGDLPGARAHLETALKWAPNLGLAQVDLADVLMRLGDEGPALTDALEAGKRLEPANPRLWRIAGALPRISTTGPPPWRVRARAAFPAGRFALAVPARGPLRLGWKSFRGHRRVSRGHRPRRDRSRRAARARRLLEQTHDLAGAEAQLTTLTQQDPKNALYRQRLQAVQVKEGKAEPESEKRALRPLRKSKH